MAKRKASRQSKKPDDPAGTPNGDERRSGSHATGPETAEVAVNLTAPRSGPPPAWRSLTTAILLLLALAATAVLWLGIPFEQMGDWGPSDDPPPWRLGLAVTVILWMVVLIGLRSHLRARRATGQIKAILAHEEVVGARLEPEITEEQSGLRMKFVSAWLIAVLGVTASAVLWLIGPIERVVGGYSILVVGATVSVMLALAVAANAINRLKTRRLARDFRLALSSERLALDTIGALDVMISACLPTGERTRFNEQFLAFFGRTAEEMQGHGWLEIVHPDDRQPVIDIVAKALSPNEAPRRHDICVRHHSGDFVWVRETLTPRFNERGELIEFIGTAINITPQVETEAALDKQIGELTERLEEVKSEYSKARTSRNRYEKSLEEAREDVKNLQEALDKAETELSKLKDDGASKIKEAQSEARDRVKAIEEAAEKRVAKVEESAANRVERLEEDLKSARQESRLAASENKKLTRAFEKLQEEIGRLREQDSERRDQVARHIKETREAKAVATEAHTHEAQHRAKNDRLTQRCEELEAQLAAKDEQLAAAQKEVEQASAAAAAEVERRLHEVSAEALATHLRQQIEGVQRMTDELLATTLDGPAKDAARNTAATIRSMSELVDQALSGGVSRVVSTRSGSNDPNRRDTRRLAASFDIRRTAQGVRDLLADAAQARGVEIEVELATNLPALVHGDDVEIRTTLMSLANAAFHLVDDGKLKVRLSEDLNTAAHSTIRCELSHASARVKTDALDAGLAIRSTDETMPDAIKQPLAHQAAKAWRTIRSLGGQHGFQLPDEGGFSVWFTFTLGRPAASASMRPATGGRAGVPIRTDSQTESPSSPAPSPEQDNTLELPDPLQIVYGASREKKAKRAPEVAPAATIAPQTNENSAGFDAGAARSMPRMPQELLTCSLGEVVELGAESMRVFCTKPPKRNEVSITFDDVEADLKLRAEVLWSKKVAGRKHDVGLKFLGLSSRDQEQIRLITMQHRKGAATLDAD